MKALLLVLCLCACSAKELKLEPHWHPITKIKERPSIPFVDSEVCFILRDTFYVLDLDLWLKERPVDSLWFNLILRHEHVHAVRQRDYVEKNWFWSFLRLHGPVGWIRKYVSNKKFRLHEEKLAYYAYIKWFLDNGRKIPVDFVASCMSDSYFGMIGHDEALEWVNQVARGRWKPLPGELPKSPR